MNQILLEDTKQSSDQRHAAGLYQEQIIPHNLVVFYDAVLVSVEKLEETYVILVVLCKRFDMVLHHILITK